MVENQRWSRIAAHAVLIVGGAITLFPVWVAFVASTHPIENLTTGRFPLLPGGHLVETYRSVLLEGEAQLGNVAAWRMMLNSLVMAIGITVGKVFVSFLAAFAIVFFRFRGRMTAFFLIFITLMLPVEVRIVPTYDVVSDVLAPLRTLLEVTRIDVLLGLRIDLELSLLNSYAGLILPLIASATATFMFRQFFRTVPEELIDAAQIDGAGPLTFLWTILLPLSRTNIAALGVILFIYGWNQYLWPLLIAQEESFQTIVVGIGRMSNAAESQPAWNRTMALTVLALLPPALVVLLMQRLFLKGLVDPEK